jgi:antitoxin component of MazEF toxin-antitoxin module
MALFSPAEFGKMLGISNAQVSVYKSRNKIIVIDGKIDDTHPVNIEFIGRKANRRTDNSDVPELVVPQKLPSQNNRQRRQLTAASVPTDSSDLSIVALEKIKKQADIKLVEERTELLRKQNEKLAGESLPADMVKALFAQHTKSLSVALKNGLERIIADVSKKKDLTIEEVADIRGKMTAQLNQSIHDAVSESKKTPQHLVKDITPEANVDTAD